MAAALGVSNALVLYHFSTKEKLVAAAFTHAAEGDLAHLRGLLGRRTSALREVTREVDTQWKAAVADVIAEGVTAGEFTCADPACAALRLNALLDGLAVQLTSHPGAVPRSRAQQWVDEALARELGLTREELTGQGR